MAAETPLVREDFMGCLDIVGSWPLLSSSTNSFDVVLLGSARCFIIKFFVIKIWALKFSFAKL